jgi:predicted MFS family arabinose efflux permease
LDLTATPRRRRTLFALLYLCEGAPIGFLWWALPTLLRERGWSLPEITTLGALLALPWTLKAFGAPLVDVARGAGIPLRWVIVGAQLLMTAAMLPLVESAPLDATGAWRNLLLLHAGAAALQDVAIDALSVAVTPPTERGRVNGWMQAGMLVGRGALSGGGLLLASRWGAEAPVRVLCALFLASSVLVLATVPNGAGSARNARPFGEVRSALVDVLRARGTWRALAFALVAGAGFEAVGAVAGPYLIDQGWTRETIGTAFETPRVVAMALGALLGGRLADRWGAALGTRRFQLAFVLTVFALAAIDFLGQGAVAALVGLIALYFTIGLFTSASYAWLMNSTAPRLAATQFSAYMGATNACELWSALAIGRLVPWGGYAVGFATMATVSLLALPLVARDAPPAKPIE